MSGQFFGLYRGVVIATEEVLVERPVWVGRVRG
jgi:hypothetical protein